MTHRLSKAQKRAKKKKPYKTIQNIFKNNLRKDTRQKLGTMTVKRATSIHTRLIKRIKAQLQENKESKLV